MTIHQTKVEWLPIDLNPRLIDLRVAVCNPNRRHAVLSLRKHGIDHPTHVWVQIPIETKGVVVQFSSTYICIVEVEVGVSSGDLPGAKSATFAQEIFFGFGRPKTPLDFEYGRCSPVKK